MVEILQDVLDAITADVEVGTVGPAFESPAVPQTLIADTFGGALDGHGFSSIASAEPMLAVPPAWSFNIPMSDIMGGLGLPGDDFTVGVPIEVWNTLAPFRPLWVFGFMFGVVLWGVCRVWDELRRM